MPSLADMRTAIAADLVTALPGYAVFKYPISAPTPPAADVSRFRAAKNLAMGSTAEEWTCVICAYVNATTDQGAIVNADALLEDDPVTAALLADNTLAGAVDDLVVMQAEQVFWDVAGLQAPVVGVMWTVRMIT